MTPPAWKLRVSSLLMTDRINGGRRGISFTVEQDKTLSITVNDLETETVLSSVRLDRDQARSLRSLLTEEKV